MSEKDMVLTGYDKFGLSSGDVTVKT